MDVFGEGAPFRSSEELWGAVASIRDQLRLANEHDAAERLAVAMNRSAHPGEVWPETLETLRDLLDRGAAGLDEATAQKCVEQLQRWP